MEGVTFGDVDEYIPESRDNVLSVSLSPHEFIEIRWDEGDRGAVHLLEASLRARPVGLDVIRAGPRYWIDKMLVYGSPLDGRREHGARRGPGRLPFHLNE